MPPEPIRVTHIFFDVDGTLVDFAAALQAGVEAAAEQLSEHAGVPIAPRVLHETRRRLMSTAHGSWAELQERSFRQVLRERGADTDGVAAAAVRRYYEVMEAALRVFDDVIAPLEELRGRGFVLVAATNGGGVAMTPVRDLLHHFWSADRAGVSKPHPEFYRKGLEHAGVDASYALMVGDRLDNDVEPAHSVGMAAVLLDRYHDYEETPPPARALIHTLADLPALVELAPPA